MISNELINEVLGISTSFSGTFQHVGLASSTRENTLSYCLSDKFAKQVNTNPNITGVFISKELKSTINSDKTLIVVKDPTWSFFTLCNYIAHSQYKQEPSIISDSAQIHATAYVSEFNVKIGDRVVVGPNATILSDVEVSAGCLIGANTVLGCEDVEVKLTDQGPISVFHDAKLIIEENVSIGANTTVIKGIYGRDTVIGSGTFVSADCHISHASQIGRNSFILNCSLSGGVTIGNNVRISPGAVISNQVSIGDGAQVTLGSIVVKDVKSNEKVSGNFAIEHNRFLYKYTKAFGPIR